MEIDIRNSNETMCITQIRFEDGESDFVEKIAKDCIKVSPIDDGEVWIKDIDNLIKALEKAKELWG